MDWHQTKLFSHWINGDLYEVQRYFIPENIETRLKFLRKYFRVLDDESIPYKNKIRKHHSEFGEAAVMILARVSQIFDLDISYAIGSSYLSYRPWAMLGEGNAFYSFSGMDELINHYRPIIIIGGCFPVKFNFRVSTFLVEKLASKHKCTTHMIMSVAICLLYDIICNGGPDCKELIDIFTNDNRVKEIDVNTWENIRFKMLGKEGRILKRPYNCKVGQLYSDIPFISGVKFEPINQGMFEGVKTIPVYDKIDPKDLAYVIMGKYAHLGIDFWEIE